MYVWLSVSIKDIKHLQVVRYAYYISQFQIYQFINNLKFFNFSTKVWVISWSVTYLPGLPELIVVLKTDLFYTLALLFIFIQQRIQWPLQWMTRQFKGVLYDTVFCKQVCYIATQTGCNGNPLTHLHKQRHKLVNKSNYWLGLQPQPLIYYTSHLEKHFHQIYSILIRRNKLLCRRIILYLLKILLIKPS